jgi:hypothetical protein
LSNHWNRQTNSGGDLEFIPYARSSRMDFLQHFLPGTPLEQNGQDSAGLLSATPTTPRYLQVSTWNGLKVRCQNFRIIRSKQVLTFLKRHVPRVFTMTTRSRHRPSLAGYSGNLSWAQHEYDFNRDLGRGEIILKGNEIDTAPPWLGGLRMHWQRDARKAIEAEWVYQGGYFLDAANAHRYPGHSLLNLRGWMAIADGNHSISLRLTNLLDER